jgi:hypothetical protein
MIQRIQTIYLLIAAILTGMLFSGPVATCLVNDGGLFEIWLSGITGTSQGETISSGQFWPVWVLAGVIMFLLLWSIFLFRRRTSQMRIVVYATILLAGLEGLIVYYIHHYASLVSSTDISYTFLVVFPLITIVLLVLAIRAIRKDELLATAYQRLR